MHQGYSSIPSPSPSERGWGETWVGILILIFLLLNSTVFAQGTLRGKITDANGESVIGATVVLKENKSIGTTADFDGNYSLKITENNPVTIIISFISFKSIEETINLKNGEVLIRNYVLQSAAQEVKQVEITAKAVKSREYYMEKIKTNSATTIDYVSSETMKKTGDANVTAAVTRVAGVSTNGSFITVRGIGDRYVKTNISGSRIPTLDPFTNNIKLDLFPASLIDNVIITKTASPDLPGDWSGAYLSIETKDYPEQLAVNIETSFAYNSQATFKDVISSKRSKTDWLGYDNSLRDHNHDNFNKPILTPSLYQEFAALGLQGYYISMGVTNDNWGEGTATGDNYFKLGLVQLGLLAPALFDDPSAISAAKNAYLTGAYKANAFAIINAQVPSTGKSFSNNWNTVKRQAPLNFTQSLSVGNQVNLFNKPLGFIAGFRYGSATQYDPNSIAQRARFDKSLASNLSSQNSTESNSWSALVNLSYKLNSNNSVSLLFMPNIFGINKAQKSFDLTDKTTVASQIQFYEQRQQLVYQLKTENYIPSIKTKLETNASYTNGKSEAPDFKNLQYWINADSTYQIGGTIGDGIHRYYRYLDDDLLDSRISAEFPLTKKTELTRKLKLGGSYQYNKKESNQYDYAMQLGPKKGALTNDDIDAYLNLQQFEITQGTDNNGIPYSTLNAYYIDNGSDADNTFGNSTIIAGFIMSDFAFNNRIRFSGGVRLERAEIFTDVVKFDELGLPASDPRRVYSESYPIANPGELNGTDILPSANLIYKIKNTDGSPVNLRLNYSHSVARPSIRELSDIATLDYELRAPVFGNSSLKQANIDNYDFRVESYFKSNDNVSVSLFYKNFRNHIELINSGGYTWQNVNKSYVMGVELEGRKIIIKHLELGTNVTFVKSETNFVRTRFELTNGIKNYIPVDTIKRTMYGQAPYAINAVLTYTLDSLGLIATVGYNVQGPRLVIASNNPAIPDVYEMPRNMIDVKVSKKMGKHFQISATAKDILNTPVRRSYKYDEGYNVYDYDKYHFGTNYILSLAYKL